MRRNRISTRRRSCEARMEYQSLESRNLLAAITVNTLTDSFDLSDGLISLREAIFATNTNAAFGDAPAGDESGDSIRIDPALAGQTIALSVGQLAITDDLIIRGFGTTIEAAANSRIFAIDTSEEVTLSRLNLENGDASQGAAIFGPVITQGGAVRFEGGGTLRLFQSHFSNNSARLGGAVYAAGGNIYATESTFSNNTSIDATNGERSGGGGLYLADESATTIILSSTFEGNVTELGNGGAIFAGASDSIFAFSNDFSNNTARAADATRRGGGGAIFSEGFIRVGQSTFSGNFADDGSGGAIYSGGSRFVVGNTIFESNVANRNGGAVYLQSGIISNFNNARFTNNEATSAPSTRSYTTGGALHVANSLVDSFGSPIDPNEPPSSLTIRSSFFQGNRSQTGGAIYFSRGLGGHALISDTTFLDNVAAKDNTITVFVTGGAIHSTGNLQIYDSSFKNNEARDASSSSRGGAVYSTDSEVEIAFSSFSGNEADFGGAVAIEELNDTSNLTIFESEFRSNRAGLPVGDPRIQSFATEPFGDGGAIHLRSTFTFPTTVFRIIGGLFEDNIATRSGGAVATTGGSAELDVSPSRNGATRFIGNHALGGDGGAISNPLTASIRDAVFSENTARNGAGIFMGVRSEFFAARLPAGQLTLSGAQITENDAQENGGGVFVASGATFINNSSNINSNTATNGADIFEE